MITKNFNPGENYSLEGAIFDIDGTILDSFQDQFHWFKHACKKWSGKELAYSDDEMLTRFRDDYNAHIASGKMGIWEFYQLVGVPVLNDDGSLSEKLTHKEHGEIWPEFRKWKAEATIYTVHGMDKMISKLYHMSRPRPGVTKGLTLALNTTNSWESFEKNMCRDPYVIQAMGPRGLLEPFNVVVTVDDIPKNEADKPRTKPDPCSIEMCMDLMGVDPAKTAHVGDTKSDILACRNYSEDIVTIAVTWGYESRSDLEKSDPDYIVDSSDELRDVFLNLRP